MFHLPVISFELEKQKFCRPGQTYDALSRVTNIEGLYLPVTFENGDIKANTEALK